MQSLPAYPATTRARDAWILRLRGSRQPVDSGRAHSFFVEHERNDLGQIAPVAAVFLTNRECPWRCLMCDLWKSTLPETVSAGAIPTQIADALGQLSQGAPLPAPDSQVPLREAPPSFAWDASGLWQIKLYNSGSFFDPHAIPTTDHPAIAKLVARFERVIVECHPALIGPSCLRFRDLLIREKLCLAEEIAPGSSQPPPSASAEESATTRRPVLEVAMGLETAHPEVLERLNKRMTLKQFAKAARFLTSHGIAVRAFILVKPPFLDEAQASYWAERSLEFAFESGATTASLIPTRGGNGAMEELARQGWFSPPKLSTLEAAHAFGIGLNGGRVFADVWDLEEFSQCAACFGRRLERLRRMNLEQIVPPAVECSSCGVRPRG